MYTCANCNIHACREAEPENMPKNCPIRNKELVEEVKEEYGKPYWSTTDTASGPD